MFQVNICKQKYFILKVMSINLQYIYNNYKLLHYVHYNVSETGFRYLNVFSFSLLPDSVADKTHNMIYSNRRNALELQALFQSRLVLNQDNVTTTTKQSMELTTLPHLADARDISSTNNAGHEKSQLPKIDI